MKIQNKGLLRDTHDKFYTNPKIAKLCCRYVSKYLRIEKGDIIIEPSAGNGSFIKFIKQFGCKYDFFDIMPENSEVRKQNYLKIKRSNYNGHDVHIIGNPPSGRQSSLAIKFIKKSCEFSKSVSFILPKSFKKDSMKKAFPLSYHLIFEWDLPDNSFIVDNSVYNVPCVFQIWEKKDYDRAVVIMVHPRSFKFVGLDDGPDISFRRIGVNAGTISTDTADKSDQSHYFIKFTNGVSLGRNLKLLKGITFEFNNTVGPKSISKQELIKKFNSVLQVM